jgi:hypothetical protein
MYDGGVLSLSGTYTSTMNIMGSNFSQITGTSEFFFYFYFFCSFLFLFFLLFLFAFL